MHKDRHLRWGMCTHMNLYPHEFPIRQQAPLGDPPQLCGLQAPGVLSGRDHALGIPSVCSHCLTLWVSNVDTQALFYTSAAKTKVHVHHICFLKSILGVKRATWTRCLLRKIGQMLLYFHALLYFYCFRWIYLFRNSLFMIATNSSILIRRD